MSIKLSPLEATQLKALEQLTHQLSPEQALWLSGYFQGLNHSPGIKSEEYVSSKTASDKQRTRLTILYGTHTGHSESIAKKLHEKAVANNIDSTITAMDEYNVRNLKDEKNLLVVVSTHGEGEPPLMAEDFHQFVTGKRAPKLKQLNYSVLALGDKSYKYFCKTGLDIDHALSSAGATPITPAVTCDVDYQRDAAQWIEKVIEVLSKQNLQTHVTENSEVTTDEQAIEYSPANPFRAKVLDKVRITGRESDKEVYHLEISLENSGMVYEPGDALGIIAQNPEKLVKEILSTLGHSASETVDTHAGKTTLEEALKHHYEVTILTRDVLKKYASKTGSKELETILNNDRQLEEYLFGHDILDLLNEYPATFSPGEFIELLRPLPPRLYSISSSQEAVGEEVHITVSKVQYTNKGRVRVGACSGYLAETLEADDEVLVYIEKNKNFRLPPNGDPIIMIGAGTGIAPYRAFLQQREATGHKGKSWLFFGERRFSSDFLYQVEWQKYLKKGFLGKIDLAFSRDQETKSYVQHRLSRQQEKLFKWMNDGAYLYLCGDKKKMAVDVEKTLLEIISKQGGMTSEKAKEYLHRLKKEKRYLTDVY